MTIFKQLVFKFKCYQRWCYPMDLLLAMIIFLWKSHQSKNFFNRKKAIRYYFYYRNAINMEIFTQKSYPICCVHIETSSTLAFSYRKSSTKKFSYKIVSNGELLKDISCQRWSIRIEKFLKICFSCIKYDFSYMQVVNNQFLNWIIISDDVFL